MAPTADLRFVLALALALALPVASGGCGLADDDAVGDGGAGGFGAGGTAGADGGSTGPAGGSTGSGGAPPAFNDDDAVLAYLVGLAARCPPASRSTVPAGWDVHGLRDAACSLWTPPGWVEGGDLTTLTFSADAAGSAGFLVIATQLQGVDWTAESMSDAVVDTLRGQYADLRVLHAQTDDDAFGLGARIRSSVLAYTDDGRPTVATLTIVFTECSPILGTCPLTGTGAWASLAQLAALTCTLRQVDASVYCPSGGGEPGCDDAGCAADCRNEGAAGGQCQGDDCMCE